MALPKISEYPQQCDVMRKRTKICVFTAARSEYGLMKWIMHDLQDHPHFHLQIVATGTHLSEEHGYTLREIEEDGFTIDAQFEILTGDDTPKGIVDAMGRCSQAVAAAFDRLQPDMLMVLGDRYELLPACAAALVMRIPIIHISGGDITEGAIDDTIRHAITKMAALHFPGTKKSAKRIVMMGESPRTVFAVGEPGLDTLFRTTLLTRQELATALLLDTTKRWAILTYHPETHISMEENLKTVQILVDAIAGYNNLQTVITAANADSGGKQINALLKTAVQQHSNLRFVESLGQKRFFSLLKEAVMVAGNSSAGIVEAPACMVPVLNIGDRQKGRPMTLNVVNAKHHKLSIKRGLEKALTLDLPKKLSSPYGDGNTAEKIIKILEKTDPDSMKIKRSFAR